MAGTLLLPQTEELLDSHAIKMPSHSSLSLKLVSDKMMFRMALQGRAPIVAVDGHVEDAGVVGEDLLRAIAKVHVPVQNNDPPCACLLRSPGRHPCSTIDHISMHKGTDKTAH